MKRSVLIIMCLCICMLSTAQIGVFKKVISDSVFSHDYRFRNLPAYSIYNALINITAGDQNLATPPGTTAQRPTVPASKYILRYNTDSAALEIGNPSQVWKTLGMSSVQTFDTSSIPNFYLKVRSLFSATAPLQYNSVTGQLLIPQATSGQAGYLASSDWVTFNSKLPDPGSNGLVARTALGTTAARQLIAASTNISLVNANGVSGNPSIDLNDTLTLAQLILTAIPTVATTADSILSLNRLTGLLEVRPFIAGEGIEYARNGLTRDADTVQLGGTLNETTTIDVADYSLTVTGTGTGGTPFRVFNTGTGNGIFASTSSGTNGIAVMAQSSNNTAVQGTSVSGFGMQSISTSNIGAYISTTSGVSALVTEVNPASTNTAQTTLLLKRYTSGTAENNIAGRIGFVTEPSSGTVDVISGYIENGWENATFASRSSYTSLYTTLNGTTARKVNIASTGQMTLDGYPALPQQTDTTNIKPLGYNTTTGLVQPMTNWIGGGGLTLTNNGITSNAGTIQLGDIAGQNLTTLTVDRYLRGGNKSIYLMGNKTNGGVANFIFKDTLLATPGNPTNKTWMEFDALDHVAAPFFIGTASVDDGTGFNNHVMNWGFNLSPLGTRVNANYGAIGISMEGAFQNLQEFHVFWVPKDNIQRRVLSITTDTLTKAVDAYFRTHSFELKDVDEGQEVWAQYTGGNGGLTTSHYLFAGTTNQYRLQTGFGVSGGNTSASISTTGPGQKEFHLDESVGDWDMVFLPSFFSTTSYNQVTTQLLPAVDGTLRLGSVTEKWEKVNSYYSRAYSGMLVGDFSADQDPVCALEIKKGAPSSGQGQLQITNAIDNSITGITVTNSLDGHTFIDVRANTAGNSVASYLLRDKDDPNVKYAAISLNRAISPSLGGVHNDLTINNAVEGKDILIATMNTTNTVKLKIASNGTLTASSLSGTGTRPVTANGSGVLGAAANVSSTYISGTGTNDNAAAGNIGEEVNAVVSTYTNYTTSATYQNITSITLTAGDWDLSAFFTYSSNSATITAAANAIFVMSTTTASAAGATEGRDIAYVPQAALLGTSLFSETISPYRISLSATTTFYLNTQATFTVGNPQYVGGIRARRVR